MRILHVVPTYFPATRYGGPIYSVHGLCRALAERGHSVEIVTTNVDGQHVSDVPLNRPVMMDGVTIRYFATGSRVIPPSLARRLYVATAMSDYLHATMGGVDVAHLHSVFLWPTTAAARAARRVGVPYVVAPRGMLVPELIQKKNRLIKMAWLRLVERKTLSRAAGIHFTSQREWDDASRTGLPLPMPFIVPNGIDFPSEDESPRLTETLLFLGRITWKKGVDRLIDALALVPGAKLVVVGNDEEELTPVLRDRILRAGLAGRVEFRGEVHGTTKESLLREATALILPSHSENFGNVVLEAMSYGMPVIVTPEVGVADVVLSAGAGLVVQNSPAELAVAIASLLKNPSAAHEMGVQGRVAAEAFRWNSVAEKVEGHYVRIMERAPRTKA